MIDRSRSLAALLALLLLLPGGSALAQTDTAGRTMGDIIADALEDLADALDPDDVDFGDIDPSDPDSPVDPSGPGEPGDIDPDSPSDGDAVDPGDIDPSDPDALPGDPEDPAEPEEPAEPGEPDGIELPEPAEPEDGGFAEIFLAPDPAPRPGRWKVTNKKGTVACTNIGVLTLEPSTQTGRITLRDDGKKLTGKSIFQDQTKPVNMTWDPESNQYRGRIRLAAPGGRVNMAFTLRVVSPRKMVGSLSARVTVNQGGISGRCTISRGLALARTGN